MSLVKRNFKNIDNAKEIKEMRLVKRNFKNIGKEIKVIKQKEVLNNFIELPKYIASKKAIINVQNDDNECFKYAVLSALHYDDINNHERVTKYKPYLDELNFKGIKFPVTDRGIIKFEKQNPQSINVFIIKDGKIDILRISKKDPQNAIDLLLLTEGRMKHYCWIRKLSALLSSQVGSTNRGNI